MIQHELCAEFRQLLDRYYSAWGSSWAEPLPLYAQDADAVYYDAHPPVSGYTSWNSYVEAAKSFFEQAESVELVPTNDQQVKQKGEVARSTVRFHLSVKSKDGTTAELDCRVTLVWEKRQGKWLIVHEHLSAPLPGWYAKQQ